MTLYLLFIKIFYIFILINCFYHMKTSNFYIYKFIYILNDLDKKSEQLTKNNE